MLKVDPTGKVIVSNTGANDDGVFKRTSGAGNERNIFLAKKDGSESEVGADFNTQSVLRVGATDNNINAFDPPSKTDTAMIVAGTVESRGGLLIRKENSASLGNQGNNLKAKLSTNYTELDVNTEAGIVNMTSRYITSSDQNTSFKFSAEGASTKLGINTTGIPQATLDVVGNAAVAGNTAVNGTLLLGMDSADLEDPDLGGTRSILIGGGVESRGTLSVKQANNGSTSTAIDQSSNYTALDISTNNGNINFGSTKKAAINTRLPTTYSFTNDYTSNVKVGINTAIANKTLDVAGDAAITDSLTIGFASTESAGTDKLKINGNTRADAYYYNSDRRYKSDIEVLTSPLANLLKISGYSYYSKLEKKDTLGVIAQEVEAVYPELVLTDADGYKSVQYGNLIAPIIEAIRELSTKIDNLFTLYVSQQAKIDTLEARLLLSIE
ncbi:tail fiber domain-containing protein [Flavobacterium sp.]|uniref:tail fiber domain-containing protein n=1 Tax=Flavobacterium sp. TaxID=239 RepID=UPI00286E2ECA|nr:tail fiber domain-containing protein [Flavobacterium sp.]